MTATNRIIYVLTSLLLAVVLLAAGQGHAGAAPPEAPAYQQTSTTYVVQRGDTLYSIARRFGTTILAIQQANNLRGTTIYAGQRLVIPSGTTTGPQVVATDVQFVMALANVNMRRGPGFGYSVMGQVAEGMTAKVTGKSTDSQWWRVICPDDTVGNCWVSANPRLTQPTTPPGGNSGTIDTNVQYVIAQTDVNIRVGPGLSHQKVGLLYAGQTARVTGMSADFQWWRVPCPTDQSAHCWVSARPSLTQPTGPNR